MACKCIINTRLAIIKEEKIGFRPWYRNCINCMHGEKKKHDRFRVRVPLWIIVGAAVILLPIFSFITFENIQRQKRNSERLMLEKGAALIRSFEAGTRTGMKGRHQRDFKLQKLLTETAQQPDIAYLLVMDIRGRILAHNDPAMIDRAYGNDLNLKEIVGLESVQWRLLSDPLGSKIFEIYRGFSPTGKSIGPYRRHRMAGHFIPDPLKYSEFDGNVIPRIIFVGLHMQSIEALEKAEIRHAIVMGGVLLLAGFSGIILLFISQRYRETKTSLSMVKVFSEKLVENLPMGLIAVDADNRITSFNHVADSMFHLSSGSAVGVEADKALPGELWEPLKILEKADGVVEKEVQCPVSGGGVIWLEVSAAGLKDETGAFLGYILLFKDLSDVKALRKEIERSQRLASVGRLAAGVAHEIRNPLSSIKGFATYFRDRYPGVSEDQKVARIMIQEVDRLNRVVSQLLDFARPVAISKTRINLTEFLEDSLKLIESRAAAKKISIRLELPGDMKMAWLDPGSMSQVLLNLLLNAVEAMQTDGVLLVSASRNPERHRILMKITDTGSGIPPKDLGHIFDPYFTTKDSGTGLGLAIVHNIIEAHGGEIIVESSPGKGTEITISLPDSPEGKKDESEQ